MKTFIYENIEALKRLNKAMDFKARLCGRSWWVFNDEGIKETFIFQNSGCILITTSGVVTRGKWEYLAVNQSIIIKYDKTEFMLKAAYGDDNLLALILDGTNEISVMIDENNKKHFLPQTFSEVCFYLAEKERVKVIEIEKSKDTDELKYQQWQKYQKLHQRDFEMLSKLREKNIQTVSVSIFLISIVLLSLVYLQYVFNLPDLTKISAIAGDFILIALILWSCEKRIKKTNTKIDETRKRNDIYDYSSFVKLPLNKRKKLIQESNA